MKYNNYHSIYKLWNRVLVTGSHTGCGTAQMTSRARVSSTFFKLVKANQPSRSDKTRRRTRTLGRWLPWLDPTILVGGWRKIRELLLSGAHLPNCFWHVGRLWLLNSCLLHLRANCSPSYSVSSVAVQSPFYQWSLLSCKWDPEFTPEIKFTEV